MKLGRVKVESKYISDFYDRDKAFKILLATFKKQVNEEGILSVWKEKQVFESKSRKKRRLRKESALRRGKELRDKLKNYFTKQED